MEINVLLYNFIVYTGIWVTYLFFYVNDQSDLYGDERMGNLIHFLMSVRHDVKSISLEIAPD